MWSNINNELKDTVTSLSQDQAYISKPSSIIKGILNKTQAALFPNGPGVFRNIHQKVKSIYPISFTGINLIVNKNLDNIGRFQMNVYLDPSFEYYSSFRPYLTAENEYSNKFNYVSLYDCLLYKNQSSNLKFLSTIYLNNVNILEGEGVCDYSRENCTSSLAFSYLGYKRSEVSLQHLHKINKEITAGLEVSMKTGLETTSHNISLVGRYNYNDNIVSSTISSKGIQVCLYKKINKQLSIGSVLDMCFKKKNIVASIGCELADKEYTLRSSIDSQGTAVVNLLKNNFNKDSNIIFKPNIILLCNIQKKIRAGVGFELLI